jgi:hypothetical protein
LAGHPDLDELFLLGSTQQLPRADFYLPLLSVPGALGTTASTIPCKIPYLSADPDLTDRWRQELAAIAGFKIGIAWQGSPDYPSGRWKAIPLAHFAPLASLPGVRLISLQKGFGAEQVAAVGFPLLDLSGRLDEAAGAFMDTAALIRSLDLVVTSDTSIAHLAGALGAPVWVALGFSPDWRWLLKRDDSPWYPTMRLFRQKTMGGWSDVFERIANAIGQPDAWRDGRVRGSRCAGAARTSSGAARRGGRGMPTDSGDSARRRRSAQRTGHHPGETRPARPGSAAV